MKIKLMVFCDKDDCIFFLTKEKGLVRLDVNKLAFRSAYFFLKYDLNVSMKYHKYHSVKKKILVCTLPINFKYYILYL